MTPFIDQIQFKENGLVTAIAQDHKSKTILMIAWMNQESLELRQ